MTTNNDKNAVGGWGGFVYFRALLRPAQAGTAFRGGVFARPAQAGTDANGIIINELYSPEKTLAYSLYVFPKLVSHSRTSSAVHCSTFV